MAEPQCRQKRQALGLPYPKSNCEKCGSLIRAGWRCAEETPAANDGSLGHLEPMMQERITAAQTRSATPTPLEQAMRAAYEQQCVARYGEKPTDEDWLAVIGAYQRDRRFVGWSDTFDSVRVGAAAALRAIAVEARGNGRADLAVVLWAHARDMEAANGQ